MSTQWIWIIITYYYYNSCNNAKDKEQDLAHLVHHRQISPVAHGRLSATLATRTHKSVNYSTGTKHIEFY